MHTYVHKITKWSELQGIFGCLYASVYVQPHFSGADETAISLNGLGALREGFTLFGMNLFWNSSSTTQ